MIYYIDSAKKVCAFNLMRAFVQFVFFFVLSLMYLVYLSCICHVSRVHLIYLVYLSCIVWRA